MRIALIYEKYSQILDICKKLDINSNKKNDDYGGLIGHVIHKKNEYLLVPCVGCMHVHNTLYCLNKKYGVDYFIRIGTCGVLKDDLQLGKSVLIDRAINKDAISEKYFPKIVPQATEPLFSLIKEEMSLDIISTYTVDITWERARSGADVVDMETSALYAYSQSNGLQAISISVCRDNNSERISMEKCNDAVYENTLKVLDIMERYC